MARTAAPADERRRRAARSAVVFALMAPVTYAALRLYEIARAGHVDPTLILRSTHIGYVWRAAIAAWWALTCAFVLYGFDLRPARVKRTTAIAAALTALVTIMSFAFP